MVNDGKRLRLLMEVITSRRDFVPRMDRITASMYGSYARNQGDRPDLLLIYVTIANVLHGS